MSKKAKNPKTVPVRLPLVCADGCWVEKMIITPQQAAHLSCLFSKPEWETSCGGQDCDKCPLIRFDLEDPKEEQGRWLEPEEIVNTLPDDPQALKKALVTLIRHMQKMNGRKD